MSDKRDLLIKRIYSILDSTEIYDNDGLLNLNREIDEDPHILPDYTSSGASAFIADKLIEYGYLK